MSPYLRSIFRCRFAYFAVDCTRRRLFSVVVSRLRTCVCHAAWAWKEPSSSHRSRINTAAHSFTPPQSNLRPHPNPLTVQYHARAHLSYYVSDYYSSKYVLGTYAPTGSYDDDQDTGRPQKQDGINGGVLPFDKAQMVYAERVEMQCNPNFRLS